MNDERSESKATQVSPIPDNVDEFMEALGDVLGVDWDIISAIPDNETRQQAKKRRHDLLGYAAEESPSIRQRTE